MVTSNTKPIVTRKCHCHCIGKTRSHGVPVLFHCSIFSDPLFNTWFIDSWSLPDCSFLILNLSRSLHTLSKHCFSYFSASTQRVKSFLESLPPMRCFVYVGLAWDAKVLNRVLTYHLGIKHGSRYKTWLAFTEQINYWTKTKILSLMALKREGKSLCLHLPRGSD